jgi:hypothetical protein
MVRDRSFSERLPGMQNARVLNRRSWLAGALLGISAGSVTPRPLGAAQGGRAAGDADEIAAVQAAAKKAGLGPFSVNRTGHFLCLGDAPELFRETALDRCESLANAFLSYFRSREFDVDFPARSSTVIALKDDASYRAFSGDDGDNPGVTVGGHYDPETNRLVIFDFRPKREELAAEPERVNLFTLVHETTHLLCFNTGLLSRTADVPACVSEGLATYVEIWRPGRKRTLGGINGPRLQVLVDARNNGNRWIPIADILANDDLCQNQKTGQLAYAESWLMVHHLLNTSAQLPKFKAYLAEIPAAAGANQRLEYAEKRLGSLKTLDRQVNRHAQQLLR